MKRAKVFCRLIEWNLRTTLLTKEFLLHLVGIVIYWFSIIIWSSDDHLKQYLLAGPFSYSIELMPILFWLYLQNCFIYIFHCFTYKLTKHNTTSILLRLRSKYQWFISKFVSIIIISIIVCFMHGLGTSIFLYQNWDVVRWLIVCNLINNMIFGVLYLSFYIFNVPELEAFGILNSLLIFIVFWGTILGEKTNYIIGILARSKVFSGPKGVSIFHTVVSGGVLITILFVASYLKLIRGGNYE